MPKNRANDIAALVSNWGQVEKATQAAYEAEGTAKEEQGKYIKSLQGYLDKLTTSWQALSKDFLDSSFLKGSVNVLTKIINLFDALVKHVGTLGTIGLANGALQLFKNGGYFKDLASSLRDSTLSMSNFGAATSMALGDLKSFMATPTGILTGIGLITAAVGVGIQAYNNYRQKISKEREEDIKEAKSAVEEASNITDLYGKYQEANAAYESNMGTKEALTEATNNLLSALGLEESEIDSLIEKYGSLDEAINQITGQALSDAVDKAISGFNAAYDNVKDSFGNGGDLGANIAKFFGGGKESVDWMEETKELGNKVGKILEDAQLLSSGSYNQGGQFFLETDTTDEIIASYNKLLEMRDTLKQAFKDGELTRDEYNDSSLVNAIDSKISSFEVVLKDYIEAKDNLNDAAANQIVFDELTNNGIPKTIEGVEELKNKLIEAAKANDVFEGSTEDISTAFNNAFKTMSNQFPELNKLMNNSGVKALEAASQEALDNLSKNLGASWEKIPEDIKIAYNDYQSVIEEIKSKGLDPNDAIFGNIDLNDRGVIEWTKENIEKYKDVLEEYAKDDYINNLYKQQGEEAIQSFFDSGAKFPQQYIDDYIHSFEDSISTVFGGSKPFEIQGQEVEIAFSPMLQTDNGAELLSPSTVDDYIKKIIESATSDGDWSFNEIIDLDAQGLEVDGKQISGLIADIGDTAIKTGESMHYLGKDGVAGLALQEFQDKLKSVNLTEEEFYNALSDNDVKKWFNSLKEEDKNLVYQISVRSDDTTLWSLTKWKEELEAIKETGQTTGEQMEQFYDIMNDTSDEGLSKNIENYTKNLETLQDALSKIKTGEFTQSDVVSLSTDFPSLVPYMNDMDGLSDAIQNLINTSNQDINDTIDSFIEELGDEAPDAVNALEALRDAINGLTQTKTGFSFDIDDEITKFDNLYAAMKESVSGTGLTKASVNNVKAMFKDLDGYDQSKLFERTANGIHLNTNELRKLQAQYKEVKTKELNDELQTSIDKYNELGKSLTNVTNAEDRSATLKEMSKLKEHITDVADLAAQYEGLTSAYNRWTLAQSSGEEGDMYDSIRDNLEDVQKMYEEGLIGTNAFRSYVDLLSGQDLSTANAEQVQAAWQKLGQVIEGTSYKATDFLAEGSDGVLNFLKATEQLNSKWAKMNSDGSWEINFGVGNDKEIADRLGVDVEFVQSMMRKLSDYGFDINLDSVYTEFDKLTEYAEQANQKLKELGQTNIDFDFNTSSIEVLDEQIIEAQNLLDKFKNTDGTVNTTLEGADEAQTVLISLITRKQELNKPAIMSIDTTTADANISSTIGLLQDFQTNYNNIEIETAVGADTSEAQTNIQNVVSSIQSLPTEVKAKLGLDDDKFQETLASISSTEVDVKAGVNLNSDDITAVQERIAAITPEMIATLSVDSTKADEYKAPDKDSTVTYDVNDVKVQKYTAPLKTGTVTYTAQMNSWTPRTKYGTVVYNARGGGKADGTANSFVKGTAFAKGNWGTKEDGTALGGELGQELVNLIAR